MDGDERIQGRKSYFPVWVNAPEPATGWGHLCFQDSHFLFFGRSNCVVALRTRDGGSFLFDSRIWRDNCLIRMTCVCLNEQIIFRTRGNWCGGSRRERDYLIKSTRCLRLLLVCLVSRLNGRASLAFMWLSAVPEHAHIFETSAPTVFLGAGWGGGVHPHSPAAVRPRPPLLCRH